MKGEFGGGAPEKTVEVVLAEPVDACNGLINAKAVEGKVSYSVYMHACSGYMHACSVYMYACNVSVCLY
jgi:hypothetical protein